MGSKQEIHNDRRSCDESKCVSRGAYNDLFTCYGDGYGDEATFYPMMCADGFLPFVLENEPNTTAVEWQLVCNGMLGCDINDIISESKVPVKYFTCCPPEDRLSNIGRTNATRHCSDPITPSINFTDSVCLKQEKSREYPRLVKPAFGFNSMIQKKIQPDSYVCCDSEKNEHNFINAKKFLEDTECVPYRNEYYDAALAIPNRFGRPSWLGHIFCNFQGEDSFHFAYPIDQDLSNFVAAVSEGRHQYYQCCREGPGMPPFVSDLAFKCTLYPLIVVYFTAAIASFVVAIGLLIPLLIELRTRKGQRSTGRRQTKPVYSTYNLYLVYLAFVDLSFLLPSLAAYWSTANQNLLPELRTFFVRPPPHSEFRLAIEPIIGFPYGIANLGINAIIAREIFILIQSSHCAKRVCQPSLKKVNLQGVTVLCASVVVWACFRFIRFNGYFFGIYMLLILVLLAYAICISILIKRRGYMPPVSGCSIRDTAVRGLVFYFFRIVVVFLSVWFPSTLLLSSIIIGSFDGPYAFIMYLLMGLQPIITLCMILMKPDVKKYIKDFVTMSYIFEDCRNTNARTSGETETSKPDLLNHPITSVTSQNSVSILGYNFSVVDIENNDVEQERDTTVNEVLSDSIGGTSMDVGNEQDDTDEAADCNNNSTIVEARAGAKYKSRRASKGPVTVVLATGEPISIDTNGAKIN